MAKTVHNDVLDAALNVLKTEATQLCVCSTQPTTYAEATSTYMLAIHTVATGDFTIADDTSGRKVTLAEQADIEVLSTGDATHIALCDVDDRLLYVTTCTSQALTDGNTVTVPAWKVSIADPT